MLHLATMGILGMVILFEEDEEATEQTEVLTQDDYESFGADAEEAPAEEVAEEEAVEEGLTEEVPAEEEAVE